MVYLSMVESTGHALKSAVGVCSARFARRCREVTKASTVQYKTPCQALARSREANLAVRRLNAQLVPSPQLPCAFPIARRGPMTRCRSDVPVASAWCLLANMQSGREKVGRSTNLASCPIDGTVEICGKSEVDVACAFADQKVEDA